MLPAFDLPAMEELLAIPKPCHVICFCKFSEMISNPIRCPEGEAALSVRGVGHHR